MVVLLLLVLFPAPAPAPAPRTRPMLPRASHWYVPRQGTTPVYLRRVSCLAVPGSGRATLWIQGRGGIACRRHHRRRRCQERYHDHAKKVILVQNFVEHRYCYCCKLSPLVPLLPPRLPEQHSASERHPVGRVSYPRGGPRRGQPT